MNKKRYPSDLTLREWSVVQPMFPRAKRRGRPAKHSKKDIVNGILYVVRTGCQWYALPKDYLYLSCVRETAGGRGIHALERRRSGAVEASGTPIDRSVTVRTLTADWDCRWINGLAGPACAPVPSWSAIHTR